MNSVDDDEAATPDPDDNTTLTSVLAAYSEAGFTASFTAVANDTAGGGAGVECHECNVVSPADEVTMSSLRRLEGASDPDDMFAVVAIACPACAARGTLILGRGPAAPAEDSDVLKALQDGRDEGVLPRNSAPGEAVGDES